MDLENVRYEERDGTAYVTLNRPEKLNALSFDLLEDLNTALWEADDRSAVHSVVLAGEGRAFCAGYDITPGGGGAREGYRSSRSYDDDVWQLERRLRLRMPIFDMHKPVVARLHGYCLAGGTDLALSCDLIIAAEDALIGYPPTRAMGGPPAHMWLYHVGPQQAKRLLFTGDSVRGAEAAQIGLVLEAVPADQLDEAVAALTGRLAMIDHELLAVQKRTVNLGLELMGARTLQRLAAETDARGHQAPSAREFGRLSTEQGLKKALEWRDTKFGDGRATAAYQRRREEAGRQS